MMRTNPLIKLLAIPLIIIVVGISLVAMLAGHSSNSTSNSKSTFMNDKASSDTPVETLKTLTAEISSVEQQNKKIIEQNKVLAEQDKITLAQFKNDMLAQVEQQIEKFKVDAKNIFANEKKDEAILNNNTENPLTVNGSDTPTGLTWISDMQNGLSVNDAQNNSTNSATSNSVWNLLTSKPNDNPKTDTNSTETTLSVLNNNHLDNKPNVEPYFTIPVNATLTGAIAMQPIIGRIPINGKVPDPYTFKVIIGAKNLAANGIDIPEDLQGIVASGIAEGDLLGRCARGDIRSMTFVFQDGRISTTEAKDNQVLGTIAATNGNPCIQGSFHTDAPLFLSATAALAGLQGYSNALSQSQLNNTITQNGTSISSLIGSANRFAAGQSISVAAQATQKWWDQRVESSFDFVYVPNINPNTKEKLKLNINISQKISIDYDSQKRKVFYAHDKNSTANALD